MDKWDRRDNTRDNRRDKAERTKVTDLMDSLLVFKMKGLNL